MLLKYFVPSTSKEKEGELRPPVQEDRSCLLNDIKYSEGMCGSPFEKLGSGCEIQRQGLELNLAGV